MREPLQGAFTDREAAIAAFDGFVGQPDSQVLVLWGVAGMGKTRLLGELQSRVPSSQCSGLIDLSVLTGGSHDGAWGEHPPAGDLLSRIARAVVSWDPSLSRQAIRFKHAAKAAVDLLRPADVDVHITATDGSVITGNTINIDSGPSAEVYAQYRRQLVEALTEMVHRLRRPGILLLDTAELLALLDDVAAEQPGRGQPPLSHWFTHVVLPALLQSSSLVKVVVAGRDELPMPKGLRVESHEVSAWEERHTVRYLASCGIEDKDLARAAHHACHGVPLWLSLIADLAHTLAEHGERLSPDLLHREAAGRPARTWLPRVFLSRLPPVQQKILKAAVVLRSPTRESLATLLEGEELPHGWFERFRQYSFVRPLGDTGHRQIHALIRQPMLADLANEEPLRLRMLHETAARYFAAVGRRVFLEETYHRFAVGDMTTARQWERSVDEAMRSHDLGSALLHLNVLTEQRERVEAVGGNTILARGSLLAGRLAFFRNQWDECHEVLQAARDLCRSVQDAAGLADAVALLSDLEFQRGDTSVSIQLAEEALERYRALKLVAGEAYALRNLSWAHCRLGHSEKAVALAVTACELSEEAGNEFEKAESLRALSWAQRNMHDYDAAERSALGALHVYRELGSGRGRVNALGALVELYLERDEFPRAEQCVQELVDVSRRIDYRLGECYGRVALATIALRSGSASRAARLAEAALPRLAPLGQPLWTGRTLQIWAEALLALDRPEESRDRALEAQRTFNDISEQDGVQSTAALLARISRRLG
ncbi:hypothetical protein [Streptomyces sp. NPDC047974]|uniref:hypothetical protein n=1 Tax=Streptomyces sp. NPDC047974 TaxID=3154343 RepID=UPI0033CC7812